MSRTRRLLRLFAVMAVLVGILVPAVAASAVDVDYQCDDDNYNPTDPDHILYGRSQGTPADATGAYMVVDLTGMTPARGTFYVFWDSRYTGDTTGAWIVGSDSNDVICGTYGDDQIWGKKGNDRIWGNGSWEFDWLTGQYDNRYFTYNAITNTFTLATATTVGAFQPFVDAGDHLRGNKGNDFLTDGDEHQLADTSDEAAFLGGGIGNDVLYLGGGCDTGGFDGSSFTMDEYGSTMKGTDHFGTPWAKGGPGDDYLLTTGQSGGCYQLLNGNDGNDRTEQWGSDRSVAEGNTGDDVMILGDGGEQRAYGGAGNDKIVVDGVLFDGGGSGSGAFGGPGDDVITGMGSASDQTADGGPGADSISGASYYTDGFVAFGGADNDVIKGGSGDDCLWGDYSATALGIPFAPATGACDDNTGSYWPAPSRVFGVANSSFVGAQVTGADTIWGGKHNDELRGGPGDDVLYGNRPNTIHPHINMDVQDNPSGAGPGFDGLFGDDGADELFGGFVIIDPLTGIITGGTCEGASGGGPFFGTDGDWADGGGSAFPQIDTSHGFFVANNAVATESLIDSCP